MIYPLDFNEQRSYASYKKKSQHYNISIYYKRD